MKYITGDLVKAFDNGDVDILAHQCNCFGAMGAGIARVIADKYPIVEERDKKFVNGVPEDKLGHGNYIGITERSCGTKGWIVNLYGQFYWSRTKQQTDYDALRSALKETNKILSICKETYRIGLPKIGCGLGGGNWNIVSEIITEELTVSDLYVYTL